MKSIANSASSLITVHAPAWKTKGGATTEYTSSAYDNCFVKGDRLRDHIVTAAVIDVIDFIAGNPGVFPLPDDDPLTGQEQTLSPKQLAFYKYRKYVSDHLRFTPFAGEPVGWMIEQAGPDLFMFSSDYPHPEGTKDPVERFESTMDTADSDVMTKFYSAAKLAL